MANTFVGREKIDFNDFFDVNDVDHIKAFIHIQNTGMWPEGFIPDNCVFSNVWHVQLYAKLADAYVEQFMVNICDKS